MDNGLLLFYAVSEKEPMGKPLSECLRVPVYLRLSVPEEWGESSLSLGDLRARRIIRMTQDAIEQGGILTLNEIAILLTSSLSTVVRDIRKLKVAGETIPTRGQNKDIGRSLEVRIQIIRLYLEGCDLESIAKTMKRSVEDVVRPIEKFKEIQDLLIKKMPLEKIVQLTKVSPRYLNELHRLAQEHLNVN